MPCGNAITSDGVVYSRLGRRLNLQMSKNGYLRVELHENGAAKKHLVHRLVATHFVPNPDGRPQVNHIDGVKTNNDASNLEWVTQSQNQIHAYETGLQKGHHVSGRKISDEHKKALCGSRWKGQRRTYWAGGQAYETPEEAAMAHGVNRQTFYNRAASPRFPDWEINVWREVK